MSIYMKQIDETTDGMTPVYTTHARLRLQQRGLSERDINLVLHYGEPIRDGFLMTRKAIQRREVDLKRELQRLRRLENLVVIEVQGAVITEYFADRRRRPSWRECR